MRNFLLFTLLFVFAMSAKSQLINCNPDPNGEPWWAWVNMITPEMQSELDSLPRLILTHESKSKLLPFMVDNSQKEYFRPIFLQDGGSCAQAAGISYILTYEVNSVRNLSANNTLTDSVNQYPSHFTWNILNNGSEMATYSLHGWNIIKESGVPNIKSYQGIWKPISIEEGRRVIWEDGYDNYFKALKNSVIDSVISMNISTPEGLFNLKHWINDHGIGSDIGGVALITCCMYGDIIYEKLPNESYDAGKKNY